MNFMEQAQRSSVVTLAAMSAVAAMSVSAFAAGPLTSSSAWQQAALSLPGEISSAIHDVLAEARTTAQADRTDISAGHQAIRATRQQTVQAIGASVLAGTLGGGQITTILDEAHTANQDERQAIKTSHNDIRQNRQGTVADIRAIINDGRGGSTAAGAQSVTDNHDGSTAQDVRAIIDTAKKDNAQNRSAIVADAQDNKSIRRTTISDAAAIRQSARAGDISKQEAVQQISAARSSAHTDIADNHTQMAAAHKEIETTRQQAAKDVASTIHQGRTGR
jgi:hypothetical protein